MDKPISAGDLVMVVRWPHDCINPKGVIGTPFRVTLIRPPNGTYCSKCRSQISIPTGLLAEGYDKHAGIPTDWLKRIDPSEELDDVKRDEEITA